MATTLGETAKSAPKVASPPTLASTETGDPFAFYEEIRPNGPVVWDSGMNAWLVLDFEHCLEVEMDEARYASPYDGVSDLVVQVKGGWANISVSQGELHEKLRLLHFHLLSPKEVTYYREHKVRPIIDFLFERILGRGDGRADLSAEFSAQLGPRVIASLFGMPWEDDALVARILDLHEGIMKWIGLNVTGASRPGEGQAVDRAFADEQARWGLELAEEINGILLPFIREARDNPSGDFASRVWQVGRDYLGDRLDETAVLGICRELFLGGSDTTVHGVSNCFYMLLTEPGLRAKVDAERGETLTSFVEEAMRVYGATQFRRRIARKDEVLAGVNIRAGEALVLVHAAAHRDPAHYGCPHQADLARERPSDHLAFNKGPRSCVGITLARSEMRDSVAAVLDRLPNMRLDPDRPAPTFKGLLMRSWRPLHVVFDPPAKS